MSDSKYQQNIELSLKYPVLFTRNVFQAGAGLLPEMFRSLDSACEKRSVLIFVDRGLAQAQPQLLSHISTYWSGTAGLPRLAAPPVEVTGGEAIKNEYRELMATVDCMMESRLCRHSFVLILGGGAVLDAVGFAASIVHRGLRTLRMPSTTLAQNDAGVGVKTGMNLHGGKNTIGTFQAPCAVINDLTFLESLSDQDWRAGISEAFKVALIKDADFFRWLCTHASDLKDRDAEAMEKLVKQCACLHLDHIAHAGDPFETGSARPLDFGHWSAHKLESMSAYGVCHGYAVGIGLLIDSAYAVRQGWLKPEEFEALYQALAACGLPVWHPLLNQIGPEGGRQVLDGLEEFREHLGGELCLTFPNGLGQRQDLQELDESVLKACLDELASRVGSHAAQQ